MLFKVPFSTTEGTVYTTSNTKNQLSTTNVTIITFKKCGSVGICLAGKFQRRFYPLSVKTVLPILYLHEATKNISRQNYPLTGKCQHEEQQPFLFLYHEHGSESILIFFFLSKTFDVSRLFFSLTCKCRRSRLK